MKKFKILVTGANGSLGKIVLKLLKETKYDYLGIVKEEGKYNDIRITKCNIINFNEVNSVIRKFKPNVIIHLAGLTGNLECEKNSRLAIITNVFGTYNILESSTKLKPKMIFASTREVYGNTKEKAKETDWLKPINVNGLTKMICENWILSYHKSYGIAYSILRFTNFYGEEAGKRGISKMIKKAIRGNRISIFGGEQLIDLLHYDDAARAIIKVIHQKQSQVLNIGYGKSIKLLSLIRTVSKITKKKIVFDKEPYRDFEVKKFSVNISRARKNLGFAPKVSLEQTLQRMVKKWSIK